MKWFSIFFGWFLVLHPMVSSRAQADDFSEILSNLRNDSSETQSAAITAINNISDEKKVLSKDQVLEVFPLLQDSHPKVRTAASRLLVEQAPQYLEELDVMAAVLALEMGPAKSTKMSDISLPSFGPQFKVDAFSQSVGDSIIAHWTPRDSRSLEPFVAAISMTHDAAVRERLLHLSAKSSWHIKDRSSTNSSSPKREQISDAIREARAQLASRCATTLINFPELAPLH